MLEHRPCHHDDGKGAKALMIYFCPTLKRMENGENVSPSFIWKTKLTKMWRRTVYGNILALTDSQVLCISDQAGRVGKAIKWSGCMKSCFP